MSISRKELQEDEVLVYVDANRKADIAAVCGWSRAGILKGPPERLEEGRFVAQLSPAVHDIMARPS